MANRNQPFDAMDVNESMILEEEIDENYEPTEEEILEYARYLGMDPDEDHDLLYIAKEGLKAPLPENWKPCKTREGDIYYFNFDSRQSQWEHPCDEFYKKKYNEAKMKKVQKKGSAQKTESKFKKNLPPGKNAAGSRNEQPASNKSGKNQNVPYQQQSAETSFSADNQSSFTIANQASPFTSSTNPKGNILASSDLANDYEKIDNEYEEKIIEYQREKQKEFDRLKKIKDDELNEYEEKLKQEMKEELENLEEDLNADMRSSQMAFSKEKEKIKSEMMTEYENKIQNEIEKLNKDHQSHKAEIEENEKRMLEEDLVVEEQRIRNDFEAKKANLIQKKKEIELENEQLKRDEEMKKSRFNQRIEIEKKKILDDYSKMLRDHERDEQVRLNKELDDYKKELQEKLEEEKRMLMIAEKQKDSLAQARKNQLKENFEKKFDLEKEKIDTQLMKQLKEYEEIEQQKIDQDVQKQQALELKQEKEKRQLQIRNEIDDLKLNLTKRLESYKQILREKYENDKASIQQQYEEELEKHKKEVQNIKTDLNSKEDILKQINQIQNNEEDLKREIQKIEEKLKKQKEQNKLLKDKLNEVSRSSNVKSSGDESQNIQIEQLKKRIREVDAEINRIAKSNENKERETKSFDKYLSKNTSFLQNKSSNSIQKIVRDISDLKSFINKKVEDRGGENIAPRSYGSKTNYANFLKKNDDDISEMDDISGTEISGGYDSGNDWISIYNQEKEKIERMKEELRNDKIVLKRTQEYLAKDQDGFKAEYNEYKLRDGNSPQKKALLKKLRRTLNDQVKKLNEDVYKIRENEFLLKNKERALRNFYNAIQKHQSDRLDSDELNIIYQNYLDLEFRYQHPFEKEEHGLNTMEKKVLSDRESKEFYERWKDILENQLSLDYEGSESENLKRDDYLPLSTQKRRDDLDFKKVRNSTQPVKNNNFVGNQTANQAGYSYDNLLRMLDLQMKANVKVPDNQFIQKQISQSIENRYKIKMVFSEHSQWLKNIKTQLNHQLYERQGKYDNLYSHF